MAYKLYLGDFNDKENWIIVDIKDYNDLVNKGMILWLNNNIIRDWTLINQHKIGFASGEDAMCFRMVY